MTQETQEIRTIISEASPEDIKRHDRMARAYAIATAIAEFQERLEKLGVPTAKRTDVDAAFGGIAIVIGPISEDQTTHD